VGRGVSCSCLFNLAATLKSVTVKKFRWNGGTRGFVFLSVQSGRDTKKRDSKEVQVERWDAGLRVPDCWAWPRR